MSHPVSIIHNAGSAMHGSMEDSRERDKVFILFEIAIPFVHN